MPKLEKKDEWFVNFFLEFLSKKDGKFASFNSLKKIAAAKIETENLNYLKEVF